MEPVYWLSAEITENRSPDLWKYLRDDLKVAILDPEAFADKLTAAFLSQQTDEWMIQFYTFLLDQEALWGKGRRPLRDKPIIRLEDNKHVVPFKDGGIPCAYLPSGEETQFPTVKQSISRDPKVNEFLRRLGIPKPDVLAEVREFVLPRYKSGCTPTTDEQYARDIHLIAMALENCPPSQRCHLEKDLEDLDFIKAFNGVDRQITFAPQYIVYIQTPDLLTWFEGDSDVWFVDPDLATLPGWNSIVKYVKIRSSIPIYYGDQDSNQYVPIHDSHGWHKRGMYGFHPHADIEGLEHALESVNLEKAVILWNILLRKSYLIEGIVETATRQTFDTPEKETKLSMLGKTCRDSTWLPDKSGVLHKPCELLLEEVHDSLAKESDAARIVAQKLGMRKSEISEFAEKFGVSADKLKKFIDLCKTNPDAVEKYLANHAKPDFPEKESPNPDRRAEKVSKDVANAQDKAYQIKSLSARISGYEVNSDKRSYLRDFYTNADGPMICQICRNEMPFLLDNGLHYFEAVECVKDTEKELYQNYLALCPTCAAKFHHANGTAPNELKNQVLNAANLEVPIMLARAACSIRFVQIHLDDLKAVLQALSPSEEFPEENV